MLEKGEQRHGWRMGAGHVRIQKRKSKHLENLILVAQHKYYVWNI